MTHPKKYPRVKNMSGNARYGVPIGINMTSDIKDVKAIKPKVRMKATLVKNLEF